MHFSKSNNVILWMLVSCLLLAGMSIPTYAGHTKQEVTNKKTKKKSEEKDTKLTQQSIVQGIASIAIDAQAYLLETHFEFGAPIILNIFSGSQIFLISQAFKDILYEHIVSPNAP